MENLMNAEQVAEILGVKIQRIWELTRIGVLPHINLGKRQFRYTKQGIENFIKHSETKTEVQTNV